MDWTKQAEEMIRSWTESQQKLWDSWVTTLQGFGSAQTADGWEGTVGAGQELVKKTLNAQLVWLETWTESFVSLPGMPEEALEWARQSQEMMGRWIETQQTLWELWFGLMKQMRPSDFAENWSPQSRSMFHSWEESMRKILEAQADWIRRWAPEERPDKSQSSRAARA